MRRILCAVLIVCASASAFAGRTTRVAGQRHGPESDSVKLERRSGEAYDVMTLRAGEDTLQVLVNESENTTIRVNGRQLALSPGARGAWKRGGWEALGANDRAAIQALYEMTHDPVGLIQAMIAVEHGWVPDVDSLEWIYGPLAPGGCGIGGKCHSEAWEALKDFLSCSGSAGTTAIALAAGQGLGAFFTTLGAFSNCADWSVSHDAFTRCCGRQEHPGDGDDPEPCDHCLPPDVDGPNPPCCYEEDDEP